MSTREIEVTMPVQSVRVGMRIRVRLVGPVEWREVVDAYGLNHGRTGTTLVIAAPEAPEGSLSVTMAPGAQVTVQRFVDCANLADRLRA